MHARQRSAAKAAAILIGLAVGSATADAQRRRERVPPGQTPPAGMCRVWYQGVPPGRQPAATDCRTARDIARRNGNARVIYGAEAGGDVERSRRDDRDGRDDRDRPWYDRPRVLERSRFPSSLPMMRWGADFAHGVGGADSRAWIGSGRMSASLANMNRFGVPQIVTWYDADGQIVQRWMDDNRDGRADRVTIYRNGRAIQTVQ